MTEEGIERAGGGEEELGRDDRGRDWGEHGMGRMSRGGREEALGVA